MPGETGEPVVANSPCFLFFAREAAGALSARHSLRPLISEGQGFRITRACLCREIVDARRLFDNRNNSRRPCESRDPYAVLVVLKGGVRRLSLNNSGRWLWVPAFAGTT